MCDPVYSRRAVKFGKSPALGSVITLEGLLYNRFWNLSNFSIKVRRVCIFLNLFA